MLTCRAANCAFRHRCCLGQAQWPPLLAHVYPRAWINVHVLCFPHRVGGPFDRQRHASGTEVKAITYSAMQINEKPGDAEIFVIVDI